MASSRDRQRKLARAKLDRQLARRAAAAKRRRQIQAGVGAAVVLALIVVGTAWALGAFDSKPEKKAAEDVCLWTPQDASANSNLKDVGTPATTGLPTSGTRAMTVTTNQGAPITAELDLASAPCAAASISYLAGKSFYDNTKCHEITAEGALRCGDPSGTGIGGPAYSFYDENVPTPAPSASASPAPGQAPAYPKGTVAMIANPPGANSSQFLIFFKDFNPADPKYPVIGKVTGGMDVLAKIGALPTVDNGSGAKVKPKTDVVIQSLTVGEVNAAPAATSAPAASPSAG
ncbi:MULTISPECIES: peptidylprolyl isomerase [Micromonospora]|uniref:Peptidylprolyl isomerase n=1 Tax=Micromonospora solifontis TaxID=2487138 RepID=A0ABX9WFX9_9ACTN|nr:MULTISPECIES: peptidylprolyl isomerase [Micromonospora]NES13445.1 peptidylprolyl isomerase [Micromonospora sp. PPF5-17B]NES37014.1 peptidylprolyl isomerase [Micromonospora solifontis]NES55539.1 peptidylprolyl isomerase [Micromonospora sp. PPF5-6]RNL98804.1 peptidylprolyl isomerase [Micromonospora solifontis]